MSANLPPLPSPVANLCTSLYPRIVIKPGGFSADQMRAYATAAIASQAAELEAMRAVAEFAAEHLSSDWPERCQEIVRAARAALRHEGGA